MVFQHFNLFPHLTVLENCTLAPMLVKGVAQRTPSVMPCSIWSASAFRSMPPSIRASFPAARSSACHRARALHATEENTVLMLGGAARAAGSGWPDRPRHRRAPDLRDLQSPSRRGRRWTGCYPIDLAVANQDARAWCWPARARRWASSLSGQAQPAGAARCESCWPRRNRIWQALEWLADELGIAADRAATEVPASGKLTGAAVNILVAHTLPEQAIVR